MGKIGDTVARTQDTFKKVGGLFTTIATGAEKLASVATTAAEGISSWWACAAPLAKFAVVGGAIAAVALVGYGIYTLFKQRKEIKKLRKQVQRLEATVQIQAAQIEELQKTVADQAERIRILEAQVAEQAEVINQQAEEIAAIRDENARIQEELAKQKEVTTAMQERIAELEKLAAAEAGVGLIPPGEPTTGGTRKASGLRDGEVQACIKVPGVNLLSTAARTCQSKVIKVTWNTNVELGNAGFNVYRTQKDVDRIKLNNVLIPTEGNGVGRNDYLFVDSTQIAKNTTMR
jgi:ABC-type multidrug transport system fused ATPase/permease subunit